MTQETVTEQSAGAPESALGMSDEAVMSMELDAFESSYTPPVEEVAVDEVTEEAVEESTEGVAEEVDDDAATEEEAEVEEESEETSDDPEAETETAETEEEEETSTSDDEADLKRILAPFKANGRDMQVQSVDEALQLMQMGANYNKKMAALKPNLRMMKMLDKHGLLDENKLNYLIDLDKRDPQAIAKLLKDGKVDPMDINLEEDSNYKPQNYSVSDAEIELDTVVEQIKDSEFYDKTLDLVTTGWDADSKQTVAKAPQVLKVIHDHMASGVYDIISETVDRERMMGRFTGVSDIEAYRQVGDALHAQGKFDHLFQSQESGQQTSPEPVTPPRKQTDDSRRNRKKAAAPSKAAPSQKPKEEFNPLGLSDEEYEKQFNANLL